MLREVGTTTRTRTADYASAIGARTALSPPRPSLDFPDDGMSPNEPELSDLSALARQFSVPLVEDLGSDWLGSDLAVPALADEPVVRTSLDSGADLALFSGDKLLGARKPNHRRPTRLDRRLRTHPLIARSSRGQTDLCSARGHVLTLWADTPSRSEIPIYRMLAASLDEIERGRARSAGRLERIAGVRASIIDAVSTIGGGSAPAPNCPRKRSHSLWPDSRPTRLEQKLRAAPTPVIARIQAASSFLTCGRSTIASSTTWWTRSAILVAVASLDRRVAARHRDLHLVPAARRDARRRVPNDVAQAILASSFTKVDRSSLVFWTSARIAAAGFGQIPEKRIARFRGGHAEGRRRSIASPHRSRPSARASSTYPRHH
jgi:hypothetical protein